MSAISLSRRGGRYMLAALGLVAAMVSAAPAAPLVDPMRGPVPVLEPTKPPVLGNAVNNDQKRPRSFDLQPPTIPHRVDGYQIDKNFNKCLDCHARAKSDFTQAVPVSATHYIDRTGKLLDRVSTRRYFCMQCHVAQEAVAPLVDNDFEGVGAVAKGGAAAPQPTKKAR